jgi:hypothetical protein
MANVRRSTPATQALLFVAAHLKPKVAPNIYRIHYLLRWIDDVVDSSCDFQYAKEILDKQEAMLARAIIGGGLIGCGPAEDLLLNIWRELPECSRLIFARHYHNILRAFEDDLQRRHGLVALDAVTMDRKVIGHFIGPMAIVKIVVYGNDLSGSGRYADLMRAHALAELLGDIEEDLESGLVHFDPESGAGWVHGLRIGCDVPYAEIDAFVVGHRSKCARSLIQLAPEAYREFGGLIGCLMFAHYLVRGVSVARTRFKARRDVLFAVNRMV